MDVKTLNNIEKSPTPHKPGKCGALTLFVLFRLDIQSRVFSWISKMNLYIGEECHLCVYLDWNFQRR